ncbi:putative mitochondrial hypothetical protein [Leptomonas pyrrhocoris]|uniref:Uncharacterized protein n=1 Tax=Leptomonas pyrrhocoris TaxID=157538 RepID=A0A0M9G4Z2_LEPPY|nr:putative mitochondrial hypothetical protein [Leptomonas pyrrhocoris]XP_015660812.1 putative mitochondrial hypothetical protein [Leptomonas pyrrhocoris]XP_015660813.1 putative mitochondrial hypothetical protein [Leptomonas pyrrhocoris]XP_015660814.1 putative mitochondrial hypothetical protein [Leptomonas pyrrhocoris]KPA82372.1 putative mitochondrial hypothetical protein [Leptomonas pyrrhocoris]KPA82373.1 putative mitochondrial hypothetical protein [Leptomonas pyrrhocoris]KPA82374.1 putative|eukprot:XP_015660811.1 putative mitochondrial hypothetical protein [Leptomonas pyrrhocoris]
MNKETASHAPSYRNDQRVFAPLSAQHPASVRRREVQRFRRGDGTHGRRAWNPSTHDELHPFPQPALLHATTCYNGVDVVETHFPETVKGSAFLRVPGSAQPRLWTRNRTRAAASTRHTYRCSALEAQEPTHSYLARLIVEDADPEKKMLREGWSASTSLQGSRGNRFIAPEPEDDSHQAAHRELNETLSTAAVGGYITPYNRVKQLNATLSGQRSLKRTAETESLDALYDTRAGPAVFKMSNADEWWDMDPVAVTRELTERVEEMKANPYSTTFRSTKSVSDKSTL